VSERAEGQRENQDKYVKDEIHSLKVFFLKILIFYLFIYFIWGLPSGLTVARQMSTTRHFLIGLVHS
jgi:hypothetical protein